MSAVGWRLRVLEGADCSDQRGPKSKESEKGVDMIPCSTNGLK